MTTLSQWMRPETYTRPGSRYGNLERTTDLGPLAGRKALALLDEQNLSITARHHCLALRYDRLAERIRKATEATELHIFIATDADDRKTTKQFQKSGYVVHVKTIRQKHPSNRPRSYDANIDNLFSFWAGRFVPVTPWDVIVLGSGDYGLSGEIAQALRAQHATEPVKIMTLSLPGSTAQDLDARINPNLTANLEIGLDLLEPMTCSPRRFPAGAPGNRRGCRSSIHC